MVKSMGVKKRWKRGAATLFFLLQMSTSMARATEAECVEVKYRGMVPTETFACQAIRDSSVVERVCYDVAKGYMLIRLSGTYYHYCSIEGPVVEALGQAESKGRFYHEKIKGNYDCRVHLVPPYPARC